MARYVVQVQNLANLIQDWQRRADQYGNTQANFRINQPLLMALNTEPSIQWFYYCDDARGITFKLYDNIIINKYKREWADEDPYIIVRGERLESAGPGTLKDGYLNTLLYKELAGDITHWPPEQRITYFEAKNRPNGPPPPGPDNLMRNLVDLCDDYSQIILYGPPGTGKTRIAQRLAVALLEGVPATPDGESRLQAIEALTNEGVRDTLERSSEQGRYALIVFHPAYEYEQFVGGIAPDTDRDEDNSERLRYKMEQGVFLRLCNRVHPGQKSVLIIDEINRGNLPKLLGELVFALEYRDHKVTLPFHYDHEGAKKNTLAIPRNLIVIGTMNSSDRSIGHIDVAIRRRFALKRIDPDPDVVKRWWSAQGEGNVQFSQLGTRLKEFLKGLNDALKLSGPEGELLVGHSYFLGNPNVRDFGKLKEQIRRKWEYQVRPLLKEYAQVIPFERGTHFDTEFMGLLGPVN